LSWSLNFLARQGSAYDQTAQVSSRQEGSGIAKSTDAAAFRALADLCHAMFNLNEFLYLE